MRSVLIAVLPDSSSRLVAIRPMRRTINRVTEENECPSRYRSPDLAKMIEAISVGGSSDSTLARFSVVRVNTDVVELSGLSDCGVIVGIDATTEGIDVAASSAQMDALAPNSKPGDPRLDIARGGESDGVASSGTIQSRGESR